MSDFCDFYGKWCGDCREAGHCLANPPEENKAMKIRYWWSDDRKFFCIATEDCLGKTTISLDRDEALLLSLFAEPPTPESGRMESVAWERVQKMLEDRRRSAITPA